MAGTTPLPGGPPPHTELPLTPLPPAPPRRRPWIPLTLALFALAIGIGTGIAIERTTHSTPVASPTATTVTATAEPEPQPFTTTDATWCQEYTATHDKIADDGKAAGAPRSLTAHDLPATAWTPDAATANKAFANYLSTWPVRMAELRNTATNPTLTLLMGTVSQADTTLIEKIRTKTYIPTDYNLYRTFVGASNAIIAICDSQ